MKLFIIGDIHGSSSWLRVYDSYRKYPGQKSFVFLGDLIDPKYDSSGKLLSYTKSVTNSKILSNLYLIRDIITHDSSSYLCLGNHDVSMILGQPNNITDKDYYKRMKTDEAYRTAVIRMQAAYRKMIHRGNVGFCFKFNKVLVSHAGISYLDKSIEEMQRDASAMRDKKASINTILKKYNVYDISPMWTRSVHVRPIPGYVQVVGHTPYNHPSVIGSEARNPTFPVIMSDGNEWAVVYIDDSETTNGRKIRGISIDTDSNEINQTINTIGVI